MQTPEQQKIDDLVKAAVQDGVVYIKQFDPLHENRHVRRVKAKRKVKAPKYASALSGKDRKRIKASQKRNRPVRKPACAKASVKGQRK